MSHPGTARLRWLGLPAVGLALACAGVDAGWEVARRADTPAAYRRFLRTHPVSPRAIEAEQRIAALAIQREPSLEGLEAFRRRFPEAAELPSLEQTVEQADFERARIAGTEDAWARFLADHPAGQLAERARGNLAYVRKHGFAGRPAEMAAFVARHPESDFSLALRHSLDLLEARGASGFRAIRLELDVRIPGAPRAEEAVRRRLVTLAHDRSQALGVPLLVGPAGAGTDATGLLRIRHREERVGESLPALGGERGAVAAETDVTLEAPGGAVVWTERFSLRGTEGERARAGSLLLGVRAPVFWTDFFVPLPRWPSSAALRPIATLGGDAAAVDIHAGSAVELRSDGSFRIWDVSDPRAPRALVDYRRPRDLMRFSGVRHLGDSVVIFGDDGLEWIALGPRSPQRRLGLERDLVGAVRAAEPIPGGLLLATSRGLLLLPVGEAASPRTLESGPLRDLSVHGSRVALLDARRVRVMDLDALLGGKAETSPQSSIVVEPGLGARRVRLGAGAALVLGRRGAACVSGVAAGRLRSRRASNREIGTLHDGTALGDALFAVGDRGLLVLDPRTCRTKDAVPVRARRRIAGWGAQLLVLDTTRIESVDASPWLGRPALAAPR